MLTTETAPLVEPETCDRCGPSVYATWEIELASGRRLTFCQHHAAAVARNAQNGICTFVELRELAS